MSHIRITTTLAAWALAMACNEDRTAPLAGSESDPGGMQEAGLGRSADTSLGRDAGEAEGDAGASLTHVAMDAAPDHDNGSESPPLADSPERLRSIHVGRFTSVGDSDHLGGGLVQVLRTETDTIVQVQLTGLQSDTTHRVAVHTRPCDADVGGEVYAIDPSLPDHTSNQLIVGVEARPDGIGEGQLRVRDHLARGEAQALVVWPPLGSALSCADLRVPGDTARSSATFEPLSAASERSISGEVSVSSDADETEVVVTLSGLTGQQRYSTLLHELPCEVDDAGEPYRLDAGGSAEADNWLAVDVELDAEGNGTASWKRDGVQLRGDAQAFVLFQSDDPIACATLSRDDWPNIVTRGQLRPAPARSTRDDELDEAAGVVSAAFDAGSYEAGAHPAGHADAESARSATHPSGSAEMARELSGMTVVTFDFAGLLPESEYSLVASDRPCGASPARPYLQAPPAGDESANRIGGRFESDATGSAAASFSVPHTARPEAQALRLEHDDGVVVGCVDLE